MIKLRKRSSKNSKFKRIYLNVFSCSQMAGPSTIGLSTEVYIYGTQIWIFSINQALANFVMITVFFPVYRNLKITSIFEYLRKRFDNSVRLLGSVLYIIRIVSKKRFSLKVIIFLLDCK